MYDLWLGVRAGIFYASVDRPEAEKIFDDSIVVSGRYDIMYIRIGSENKAIYCNRSNNRRGCDIR